MKFIITALLVSLTFLLNGCRTLDPSASIVKIVDRPPNDCKQVGVVNVDWSWWGDTTENLNAMRNQTAEMGGNALLVHGDAVGTAYSCPTQIN